LVEETWFLRNSCQIDIETGRNLLDRIGLMQDLEDLLQRKVDVANQKTLREYFGDRILQEAIPL
jgi:uncharacterized protein